MAKKADIGVGGVARKVKKGYIGVGGVARKIKKAYIGVGGVARPCWSVSELTAYGPITNLRATSGMSIPSNLEYIVFGSGDGVDPSSAVVTAYNRELVQSAPPNRSNSQNAIIIGANEAYSVMGGGFGSGLTRQVDAYSTTLTKSTPSALSVARCRGSGAKFMGYAALAGGMNGNSSTSTPYTNVDLYNMQLSRSTLQMSIKRVDLSAVAIPDHWLLFSGGWAYGVSNMKVLDAFGADLTRTSTVTIKEIGGKQAAGCVGGYGIFTGAKPLAYDKDLTVVELPDISAYGATGYYSGSAEL